MSTRMSSSIPFHIPNALSEGSQDSGIFSIDPEDYAKFPLLRIRGGVTYDWEERRFVGPNEMTSYERSRSASPMTFQRSNMTSPNSDRALVPYQDSSLGKPLTLNINSAGGINGKEWNVLRTIPNGAASTTTFNSDSSGYLEEGLRKPIRHTISQENIYKSEHIKNPTQGTEFKEEYILETTTRITNGRSSSDSIERTNYPLKRARSETRLSSYSPSPKSVTFGEGNQQARNGSIISYGNSFNDIFKLYQTRDCLGYVLWEL